MTQAAMDGDLRRVKALLEDGVDPDVMEDGWTPLTRAAEYGHAPIVSLLLEAGADVHLKTGYGWSPIMLAADEGHEGIVTTLMHACLRTITETKEAKLIRAAQDGRLDEVEALLEAGADIDAKQNGEWRMICRAAEHCGLKPGTMTGTDGPEFTCERTALLWAAANGHTPVVKRLLDSGAKTDVDSCWDNTALQLAVKNGHADTAKLLLEAGLDMNREVPCILKAVKGGHVSVVKLLLEAGANPDTADGAGSCLAHAVQLGYGEIARLLLDAGADPDRSDLHQSPLLSFAVSQCPPGIVKLLLDAGADVSARDKMGWTALMHAAANGRTENAKLLLAAGAGVDVRNASGWTALMNAAKNGHKETVQLLLEAGADASLLTPKGKSALDLTHNHDIRAILQGN